MLKLLNAGQIRLADKYTIENESLSSSELMERAAQAFVKVFVERFPDKKSHITICAGKGNNGGDGLAIARLLLAERYVNVHTIIADFSDKKSSDFEYNLALLQQLDADIFYINDVSELELLQNDIIIDALFGSGLSRPLENEWARLVKKINQSSGIKVSIDLPSGLPAEGEISGDAIIKADWVITFQRPKLSFLLPGSGPYIKEWKVVNIGLNENFIQSAASPYYWVWKKDIQNYLKPRQSFDHKGLLGHALIIAGDDETMGAALLSAEACHRTGSGLTTVLMPESGVRALNARLPEAMYFSRKKIDQLNWNKFNVVGIGSGLGIKDEGRALLLTAIEKFKKPIVIDADALNILSEQKDWLEKLPENSVLTPHMKEFDRLFGEHQSWWKRIDTAFKEAIRLKIYIVLKNRYTMIFSPQGMCYFNSSGAPAMASGGMGDALTGMISSMIAQGYAIEKAILLAVFSHGYAGEQLAQKMFVVPASNLIKQIPYILKEISLNR
jgi:hydroxyethylthiazole kinase-like uncharacterized protein yjeF